MSTAWAVAGAACVAFGACAVWLARERRESARLRSRLEESARQLQQLQLTFSRFAPDALVERVIAGGIPTTGEKKEVSVLFADLVGFTALAERIDPTALVEILNGYFEAMSRAIAQHRGHISNFLGDGLLALFGALEPNPWHADDSAHAALAMRKALELYNDELETRGHPRLEIGVGLHRGSGVAGLVGSSEKKEFAIVGRTVNVAARLQDLTRKHDADILCTADLRAALDPRFNASELDAVQLRGIAEPIVVFGLDGFDAS